MHGTGQKTACTLMIMLCILMQAIMFIPHHHHSQDGPLCFDQRHIHSQSCGCDSRCNHPPQDNCSQTHIDALQTGKKPLVGQVVSPLWVTPANLHASMISCDLCSNNRIETLSRLRIRKVPPLERFYTAYITPTLPGRAPATQA